MEGEARGGKAQRDQNELRDLRHRVHANTGTGGPRRATNKAAAACLEPMAECVLPRTQLDQVDLLTEVALDAEVRMSRPATTLRLSEGLISSYSHRQRFTQPAPSGTQRFVLTNCGIWQRTNACLRARDGQKRGPPLNVRSTTP